MNMLWLWNRSVKMSNERNNWKQKIPIRDYQGKSETWAFDIKIAISSIGHATYRSEFDILKCEDKFCEIEKKIVDFVC
jgi:hypothetical protein